MTVEELLLYDSTTRKKAPTEVRAILRYMKKKGGEKPLPCDRHRNRPRHGTHIQRRVGDCISVTDLKVCFIQLLSALPVAVLRG